MFLFIFTLINDVGLQKTVEGRANFLCFSQTTRQVTKRVYIWFKRILTKNGDTREASKARTNVLSESFTHKEIIYEGNISCSCLANLTYSTTIQGHRWIAYWYGFSIPWGIVFKWPKKYTLRSQNWGNVSSFHIQLSCLSMFCKFGMFGDIACNTIG